MSVEHPARDQEIAPSAKRSISSLLTGLSKAELERLAADVIVLNRRYLQQAQELFDRLQAGGPNQADEMDGVRLRHDYHLALINLNGHHEVVSAVVDALGYVPDVSGDLAGPSELN